MMNLLEEMTEQLINLIEPTEDERKTIIKCIEKNNISFFMENYNKLDLLEKTKEKIKALKAVLDATSTRK